MKTWNIVIEEQKEVCRRLNLQWTPVDLHFMIAINLALFTQSNPINGLRHPKEIKIDGWYIWTGGEIPAEQHDFFVPIHAEHLIEKRPVVFKYLGLPCGYRFQIDDDGYEDIWYDGSILNI